MKTFILALSALLAPSADQHESLNPVFRQLRQTGLSVGAETPIKFPAPLCPDGLSAREQQALLKKIVGEEFRLGEFTRNSTVAPFRLRIREISPAAPRAITRRVEVVFVAHGDLKTVANKGFLDRVLDVNREEGKATSLEAQQLKKRGITLKDAEHEGYGHLAFRLIDRVDLHVTGRSYWSQTPESIVVASQIDNRFRDDADYPNRWRAIKRGRDEKASKFHPYQGAGYYVKITRLSSPKGALFVEAHIIFNEPHGWFDGSNLLRSKLPPVMQSHVRTFRRELLRASPK